MERTQSFVLDDRAPALAAYPHAKRAGDLIFVSGISSRRPDQSHAGVAYQEDGQVVLDIGEQTRAVLRNIQAILARAGSSLEAVVDLTTFLVDMKDYAGYNTIYNEFFDAATGPARTTVAVHQLPHPHLLIEIKAVAFAPLDAVNEAV
jgi:2-aminomuconate deaminase